MNMRQCKKCGRMFLVDTRNLSDGFNEYLCKECSSKQTFNNKKTEVIYWQ